MGLRGVGRHQAMRIPVMPKLKPWMAVALALGAVGVLDGCQKKTAGEAPQHQARAVSVVAVAPREIQGGLIASGALIPREDIAVFPQLTGYRVAQVLVDVGAKVAAGQPLARLDDTLLQAQLAQQTALAAQQSVLADEADAQATRVKGLDKEGLLSQEQIDTRRFAARSARAQANAQAASARDLRTRAGGLR